MHWLKHGNSELISFLDKLKEVSVKKEQMNYFWWPIDGQKVISIMNAVIREFE